MTRQIDRPNVGLSIYGAVCGVAATAFAAWMYALLAPTKAENPGLAAYKPPPAAIVEYGPATLPPAPLREVLTVVDPNPPLPSRETAAEPAAPPVLQHPSDVNNAPAVATRTKTAVPKRQVTVRRNEPRQRTNEFAFQSFFGGFRPGH